MFTRRSFFAFAGITLTVAAASSMALDTEKNKDAKKVELGEKVPAFTATDTEGNEHSLKDFEGNILVLEWINPDCPYIQRTYDDGLVKKTIDELKEIDENIEYVAVNTTHYQGPEVSKQWLKKHELSDIVALVDQEGTLGRMFDARTTPHMFVIDGEGVLRYHGAFDSDPRGRNARTDGEVTNYVIQAVNQIKAGETVAPDYVKPWGCSVKLKNKRR